jgi:predicted nucleotidyltransferase
VKHNVKTLFAFGSVATDGFNKDSDVDLPVSFNPMDYGDYADNYFILIDKSVLLFNRPVGLVTEKSLSNPYFIDSVNPTKTMLHGS